MTGAPGMPVTREEFATEWGRVFPWDTEGPGQSGPYWEDGVPIGLLAQVAGLIEVAAARWPNKRSIVQNRVQSYCVEVAAVWSRADPSTVQVVGSWLPVLAAAADAVTADEVYAVWTDWVEAEPGPAPVWRAWVTAPPAEAGGFAQAATGSG